MGKFNDLIKERGYEPKVKKTVYIPTQEEKKQWSRQEAGLGGANNLYSGGVLGAGPLLNRKSLPTGSYTAEDIASGRGAPVGFIGAPLEMQVTQKQRQLEELQKAHDDLYVLEGPYGYLANDTLGQEDRVKYQARYDEILSQYGADVTSESLWEQMQEMEDALNAQKGMLIREQDMAVINGLTEEERNALTGYALSNDRGSRKLLIGNMPEVRKDAKTGKITVGAGQQDSYDARVLWELEQRFGKDRLEELASSYERQYNEQQAQAISEAGMDYGKDTGFWSIPASVGAGIINAPANMIGILGSYDPRYPSSDAYHPGSWVTSWSQGAAAGGAEKAPEQLVNLLEIAGQANPYANEMGGVPSNYRPQLYEASRGTKVGEVIDTVGFYAYEAVYTTVDSLARAYLGGALFGPASAGAKAFSLGLAGLKSFGDTYNDVSAKGGTPGQALALGAINAGVEVGTEYIPMERWWKAAEAGPEAVESLFKELNKAGLTEMIPEEIGFLATTMAEFAILREKSEYPVLIRDLMASGMTEEEAEKAALMEFVKQATGTAVVSYVSGMLSDAGALAYNSLMGGSAGDVSGQSTDGFRESIERLNGLGLSPETALDTTAKLYSLSQDYGEGADVFLKNYDPQQDVYDYAAEFNRAYEIGRNNGNREYLEKEGAFSALSRSQREIAYRLGTQARTAESGKKVQGPETEKTAPGGGYGVSSGGGTIRTDTGDTVEIRGFASLGRNPEVALADGSTVQAADISYASADEAAVYETVGRIYNSARSANAMLETYRKSGISGTDFAAGLEQAYNAGLTGSAPLRQVLGMDLAGAIPEGAVTEAFKRGRAMGRYQAERKEAAIRRSGKPGARKEGKLHFDRKGRSFSPVQEASLGALEALSKALGIDIYVYESYTEGGKRVYQSRSGEVRSAPNGWYDEEGIHIDLNAGNLGQGTMMFTVAHELTHFIKQWSPVKYQRLAQLLVDRYGEQGVSLEELISGQITKAEKNGRTIDRETAFEEVVADSMEVMLARGDAGQFMAALQKQDKTLWQKVKDWFKELAEKLRGVVDAYQGYTPDSPEGRLVAQMEDFIGVLQEAYAEALVDAGERYRASGGNKITTREGGEKKSDRYNISQKESLAKQERFYSWDFLTALEPMKTVTLPEVSDIKGDNNKVNKALVVDLGMKNAEKVGFIADGKVFVTNNYTGRRIRIDRESIRHSLNGDYRRLLTNSRMGAVIGEIVQNAVPVNGRTDTAQNVLGTYSMAIYATDSKGREFVGIITVEERTGKIESLEYYDVAHAVSGRQKNDSQADTKSQGVDPIKAATISIEDFLSVVKSTHQSILSKSVLQHYGETRNPKGDYANSVLYSDRDPTAAATAAELEKQNVKLREDVDNLRELLRLQGKETGGTAFKKSSVDAAAKYLMDYAGASGDRQELSRMLSEFYSYIATDKELTWESVMERAKPIADWIQSNVKVKPQMSDYARDVLKEIRGRKITLDGQQRAEVEHLYGSYEAFRKGAFGNVTFVKEGGLSLDSFWHEMASMFPGTFDENISSNDQPQALLDAIDAMRNSDMSQLEYAYNREIIAQDLARAVYDSYWRVDSLRTVADRYRKEINELRAKHRGQMEALRTGRDETIRRLKEQRTEDIRRVRQEYRERTEKKLRQTRERYQESSAKAMEGREAGKVRKTVERHAKDLMDMLSKPTKEAHVPLELQKPLEKFLGAIDFTSKRQAAGGEATIRDVAYTRALLDVKLAVAGQRTALEGNEDGTFALDVPPKFLEEIDGHIKMIHDATDGLDLTTNRVYEMTSDELRDLAYILGTINKAVRQIDRLHMAGAKARVSELGSDTVREMGRRKPVKGEKGGAAMWANYTPTFAFERMGKAATQILDGLKQGQGKLARTIDGVIGFAGETYTSKEVKAWEKQTHSITLDSGEEVRMSAAQIMSFYCLSKREQARGHLSGGGMRIGNIGEGRSAVVQKEHYVLTQNDIATINGLLTDRQREVADKLQRYMADVGGRLGNEISMARWDYAEMTDRNYFPIKSDSDIHDGKNPDQEKTNLWALLNKSFTKAVTKGANDAIVVSSVFDVFADHMSEAAEYNAFALPLVDAMKWYNWRDTTKLDNGQIRTRGVKKAMNDTLGTAAGKYFIDLMTDINSSQKAGRYENLFGKLLSRSKASSVGWNLRVAIQQPTAILRASVYLSPGSLAKGALRLGTKKLAAEMKKYSGIALWKSLGYYDLNISRSVKDQIKGDTSVLDQMNEMGMWLPGKMDEVTWARIWAACKAQVSSRQGLTGEALLQESAKLFEEIVYHTQVADSVLTRSSLMRSKSQTVKELTSFMAEPTLSANLLLSAFQDYREGVSSWDKAKRTMRIGLCGYVLSSVVNALVTSFADAWRDDDEYEEFWEKYLQAFFGEKFTDGNLFAELNPLEKIVFIRDVLSLLKGYDSKSPYIELVESCIDLVTNVRNFLDGKGSLTGYGVFYQALQVLGNFTGAAPANLAREVVAAWNNTFGKASGKIIHRYETDARTEIRNAYKAGSLTKREAQDALVEAGMSIPDAYFKVKEWETGSSSKYTDVYAAVLNGEDITNAMKELTDHGKTEKEVLSELKKQIGAWYYDPESETNISRERAEKMLGKYFDLDAEEIESLLLGWDMRRDAGFPLDSLKSEFLEGNVTGDEALDYLTRYCQMDREDARERVEEWAFEKEHGYSYDDIRQTYVDGEISGEEARDVMMERAGKTREQADYSLRLWDFEKEKGWRYEERASLYKSGKISSGELRDALVTFGGYETADAGYQIEAYDWEKDGLEGATTSRVEKWHEYCQSAGVSKEMFLQIHRFSSDTKNDVDANGKTINYSAMKKVMAQIDALPLTESQKDALARSLGWSEKNIRKYKPW